jgi:hypothetical protein
LNAVQDAQNRYREAVSLLRDLRTGDPANERLRSVLTFVLLRQTPTLLRAGDLEAATESALEGLALLRAQATRPTAGPTDQNEYASWLLTCEPARLRDPVTALRFARLAVAKSRTPVYLDTLALALFQTGNRAEAVRTAEEALSALPSTRPGEKASGLRAEIEGHLATFKRPGES